MACLGRQISNSLETITTTIIALWTAIGACWINLRLSQAPRSSRDLSLFQAVPSMRESGGTSSERASGGRNGLMAVATRVTGLTIRPTGSASYSMQTETSTRASGRTTRPMARAHTLTQMGLATRATGETINSTGSVLKRGLMEPYMKANTLRARKTAKESSHSLMARYTTETSR